MSLPESFYICGQDHFSRESALWAFRRTNRLAMVNWQIGKETIAPEVIKEENRIFDELDRVEKQAMELYKKDKKNAIEERNSLLCREYLTSYSNTLARSYIEK